MKFPTLTVGLLMLAPMADAAVTLTDSTGGSVPDGSLSGLTRSLALNVPDETITSISVTLQISGNPFLGDLYAYLSDGTTLVTLVNRPGRDAGRLDGYDDVQVIDVTFSDIAATDFHTYRLASGGDESMALTGPLTGTFQPDGRDTSPTLVETGDPRTSQLSDFNGLGAQRTFFLFVADLSTGATHQVDGWSLNVETVPEPSSALLAALGSLALFRRRVPRRPAPAKMPEG